MVAISNQIYDASSCREKENVFSDYDVSSCQEKKFASLRNTYQFFCFQNYEYILDENRFFAKFTFSLDDKFFFYPTFEIPQREFYNWTDISENQIDTLVFHIGMVELISYWKLACPKRVIIKPFYLDEEQVRWWKKLYYNGLGEFFYLNGINISIYDFMEFGIQSEKKCEKIGVTLDERVIVPVGGGKDSVVTLESLKNKMPMLPFIVNPRGATKSCVETAGFAENQTVIINRTLDSTMLRLNKEGFLNGHTPFSALLAFFSMLTAFVTKSKYIALSNESSANEPTVPDTEINHQYSKSLAFESDFRDYVGKYINTDIQYFSFLRPLNELQIAKLFSQATDYHGVFKSCNAGSKTDSWCGKCPKCLFTWLALSPFINRERLTNIFGKDLLKDKDLIPLLQQLDGTTEVKPFECVGTVDEVKASLNFILQHDDNLKDTFIEGFSSQNTTHVDYFLHQYDENNFLPEIFKQIIKDRIL